MATKKKTEQLKTCGSCSAGILLMQDGIGDQEVVETCDECGLFETDQDAAVAVQHLLILLHTEYKGRDSSDTVADAMERLQAYQKNGRKLLKKAGVI